MQILSSTLRALSVSNALPLISFNSAVYFDVPAAELAIQVHEPRCLLAFTCVIARTLVLGPNFIIVTPFCPLDRLKFEL